MKHFPGTRALILGASLTALIPSAVHAELYQLPLAGNRSGPPVILLTMQRDHRVFLEAYDDYSDINGDGVIDTKYKPDLKDAVTGKPLDYYGYFDSHTCYKYGAVLVNGTSTTSTSSKIFYPVGQTRDGTKKCSTADGTMSESWSGDFLNYMTMTRMDALRKVFYGGKRSTDNLYKTTGNPKTYGETVLERAYIPDDLHAFGKEYTSVAVDGYDIRDYAPLALPVTGKRHLFANLSLTNAKNDPMFLVWQNRTNRIWEWTAGPFYPQNSTSYTDSGNNTPLKRLSTGTGDSPDQYIVRVQVCANGFSPSETDYCKKYGGTHSKPTGILHTYGEDDTALFGLLTGSYQNNFSGGVLRKAISSFKSEVNATSGQFDTTKKGIVYTMDNLKITGFNAGYSDDRWWGNPIAEMMYEGYRYFAGKTTSTSNYSTGVSGASTYDTSLGLPLVTSWSGTSAAFASGNICSKPIDMVISDITPTFDSDEIPGSTFKTFAGDISGLDVSTMVDAIWNTEVLGTKKLFIGEKKGSTEVGLPTAKNAISGFSGIRGLTPEDPAMEGTYYAAGIAKYAKENDLSKLNPSVVAGQSVQTVAVALSSAMPRMQVKLGDRTVTVIPYGKHDTENTGTAGTDWGKENRAARVYVESMYNVTGGVTSASVNGGRPYYKFRVVFDDGQFGRSTDNDMDVWAIYEVFANADGKSITVNLCTDPNPTNGTNLPVNYPKCDGDGQASTGYSSVGWLSHIGYVIDGVDIPSNEKSVRLVVRSASGWSSATTDKKHPLDLTAAQVTTTNFTDDGYNGSTMVPVNYGATAANPSLRFNFGEVFNVNSDTGASGGEFVPHDPLWYAAKYGGYQDNNKNLKLDPDEVWAGSDGVTPRSYFRVTNPALLKDQIYEAISQELPKPGTGAPVVADSVSTKKLQRIYQGRYLSTYWSGQLLAYDIDAVTGNISGPVWDAGNRIPSYDKRNIFSYRYSATAPTGINFTWTGANNLSAAEQSTYFSNTEALFNYIRGDRSKEGTGTTNYRVRASSSTSPTTVLGDMINSPPVIVSAESQGFEGLSTLAGGGTGYTNYLTSKAKQPKVVYVGANDGMLHGFNAEEGHTDEGKEILAYVPHYVMQVTPNITKLADRNYSHRYFVDGPLATSDVYVSGTWRTILVGTLGAGGKAVFALDVGAPGAFDSGAVLWEFTHPELGNVRSEPVIKRLSNGEWYVIVANGFESLTCDKTAKPRYAVQGTSDAFPGQPKCTDILDSSGTPITARNAKLFMIKVKPNLADGWTADDDYFVIHATDVQVDTIPPSVVSGVPSNGTDNGLTGVTVVQGTDGKDYAYAGDLQGNLWKFNLTDKTLVSYGEGETPTPWFVAKDINGNVLPITTAPAAIKNPKKPTNYCVNFGTGRYVYASDLQDKSVQSVFGLIDDGGTTPISGNRPDNQLREQKILVDGTTTSGYAYRLVSNNALGESQKGWYLDLKEPAEAAARELGERVVQPVKQTLTRSGVAYVTINTTTPGGNDCDIVGTYRPPIDVETCSGTRITEGTWPGSEKVQDPDTKEMVYANGMTPEDTDPKEPPCYGPTIIKGCTNDIHVYSCPSGPKSYLKPPSWTQCGVSRTSWRQLR